MASKKWFSGFGLASLALGTLALLGLVSGLGSALRFDLTENSLYTLSEGTENIVDSIEKPVTLKLFFSYSAARDLPEIRSYGRRVESLLKEIVLLNEDKLDVVVIDPEPFSEEEDAAAELGLQAVPVSSGDEIFFGIAAVNDSGDKEVIPFLRPDKQAFLEYELAQAIYRLGLSKVPTVGLMSTLDVRGGFDMMTRRPKQPWMIFSQLEQVFNIEDVSSDVTELPESIDLLMLIHPKGLSDDTLYAIDQFVLAGGRLIVFLDPRSEWDQPSMPMGGEHENASSLDQLLAQWGVSMPQKVLLDDGRAAQVSGGARSNVRHLGVYSFTGGDFDTDDVATSQLNSLNMATSGVFVPAEGDSQVQFIPLLKSSKSATLTEPERFKNLTDPRSLSYDFKPDNKAYAIVARLSGNAKTAFPDGVGVPEPVDEAGDADTVETQDVADDSGDDKAPIKYEKKANHLDNGEIQVMLVADTDLLADQLWVQVQSFFGQTIAQPFSDNGTFVMNAVENLLGSSDLIKIRSRARYSRPFDKVQELQQKAGQAFREREKSLNDRLKETEEKLAELQQPPEDGVLTLSQEQQDALVAFQEERLKVRKELREVKHQLNSDIDQLGVFLKLINILLVPGLICAGALLFGVLKREKA